MGRTILAVIVGLIIGSVVNMMLIMTSSYIIPLPDGVDLTNENWLAESIHLFQPKHFIMPFLAHALGTLVGAIIAALISKMYKMNAALIVGILFLTGGIINVYLIGGPIWFTILDLGLAYIPMAYLGGKIGAKNIKK